MHALNMHTFILHSSCIVFLHDVCVLVLFRNNMKTEPHYKDILIGLLRHKMLTYIISY